MEELEETCCEVKRAVHLQNLNWHNLKFQDADLEYDESCRLSKRPSHLSGGFLDNGNYAWLSCGSKLVILNVKTGTSICCKAFREPIACVSPFPSQLGQLPLLLIGLDSSSNKLQESFGTVCIFDCKSSQILRSIRMPANVEKLCVINGGAEWKKINEDKIDNCLLKNHGLACVALRNLDYFLLDLRRNQWERNQYIVPDENNISEIYIIDEKKSLYEYKSKEHVVLNLMNDDIKRKINLNHPKFESSRLFQETFTNVILYSEKIGCVIVGCLGRILIWQNNRISWISPFVDKEMIITHIALLEPADDPRSFYYLWVSYENKVRPSSPILKMFALLFKENFSEESACNYLTMEAEPSLKFELKLQKSDKIVSLKPIPRGNSSEQSESIEKYGENSLLLISVEGKVILFDLNQWYKEQMPRSVSQCHNINSILAIYQTKSQAFIENPIDCAFIPSTLKEFSWIRLTSPEEFYYPYSLTYEWIELGSEQITFWIARGLQAHLLRKIATSGSIIMNRPSKIFYRCVTAGLIPSSPDNSSINDIDSQRDALLTLCLEQRSSLFLLKCAKEWYESDCTYMYSVFVRWSIQRASDIKITAHRLCHSLFDQSGHGIGEAEIQMLRFLSQQMDCLCNIVEHLPKTEDTKQQCQAFHRISMYLEILLWFYDVGLLPEVQNMEGEVINDSYNLRIPYPIAKLSCIYNEKRDRFRQKDETNEFNKEILFIDELISRECPALRLQWKQERYDNLNGDKYPPPSIQSLIRSCLMDCYHPDSNEIENKHQIIIYLLMDLVMLLHNTHSSVGQLIKYPSAFKLSPSLIKLTHALWFLDHEDYQGFIDIMIGQLVLDSDIKNWHHEFILRTLLQCNQNKFASIYIRIRKPPLPSINDQSTFVTLSIEHGLVQSIFHKKCLYHNQLLINFFRACQLHGKLNDVLHLILNTEEEKAFMEFLEQERYEEAQLLYYLQRCRYIEANSILQSDKGLLCMKKKKQIPVFFRTFQALNTTLPGITQKITENLFKTNKRNNLKSSPPRPMSYVKSCVSRREVCDTAVKKVNDILFQNNLAHIPFLSAPCLFLETANKITHLSSVHFAKNLQLYSQRHSLHQLMTSENIHDTEELTNRFKMTGNSNEFDDSVIEQVSLLPIRDTPLIERKRHIVHTPDTLCETPQSILKIRQMIQNSLSSSGTLSSLKKSKTSDKEKKTRQIRFNIYQSMVNEPINESSEDSMKKSPENQVSSLSDTSFIENDINMTSKNEIFEESEDIHLRINTSTKSIYEESLLTNTSVDNFKNNMINSYSKPQLKRRDFSESGQNSLQTSFDYSLNFNEDLSTYIYSCVKETDNAKPSSSSTSIYASTVLSPGSSFEFTSTNTPLKDNKSFKKIFSPTKSSSCLFTVNKSGINEKLQDTNDNSTSHVFCEDRNIKKITSKEIDDVNTLVSSTSYQLNNLDNCECKSVKPNLVEATQNALTTNLDTGSTIDNVITNIDNRTDYINSLDKCNNKLTVTTHIKEVIGSKEFTANCYVNIDITDDESEKSFGNHVVNEQNTRYNKMMAFTSSSDKKIHDNAEKLLDVKSSVDNSETPNSSNEITQFGCNNSYSIITRSRRASSVIPIVEKSNTKISENIETQQVEDLTTEEFLSLEKKPTLSSEFFKSGDSLRIKKKRNRRSRSLTKDIPNNTINYPKIFNNSCELTVRRSTRNSALKQKKITSSNIKTYNKLTATASELVEESAKQLNKNKQTIKTRRNITVPKNSEIKTKRPTFSENDGDQASEHLETRLTSISSNIAQDIVVKKPIPNNKTKESSVSKKSSNSIIKRKTQLRLSEMTESSKISEDLSEYVPLAKRTRSASMSKENTEDRLSKRRYLKLTGKALADDISIASRNSDDVKNDYPTINNKTESISKQATQRKRSISESDFENSLNITKSYVVSINPIPEENEITSGLEKQTRVIKKSRQRRAMSVDLVLTASKRQTRKLSNIATLENSETKKELNESELKTCMENISTTKNLRRSKRAKSETTELNQTIAFDNSKQNSKKSVMIST